MIGILLCDNAYENDIRELLMAFYPGEKFVHERTEGVSFYTEGTLITPESTGETDEIVRGEDCEDTEIFRLRFINVTDRAEAVSAQTSFPVDYEDRKKTKSLIKRTLYRMLSERTGRELPWGTLTGIRPTKIALGRLENGVSTEEIRRVLTDDYLVSGEKADLTIETAKKENDLLDSFDYKSGYSLYIGIPFCPTTCLYCSFTSFPIGAWKKKVPDYINALFKEMTWVSEKMKGKRLDTVYFGGGTPTSLEAEEIDEILCKLEELFDLSSVKEVTVEAGRPDSITEEKLKILRSHGITRISVNPQTMKQETLDLIGRLHTVDMIKEKYALARDLGFDNINMDIIMGLPGEDANDVRGTMSEIEKLAPESVTVHSLAVKRAARLNLEMDKYASLIGGEDITEMIDLAAKEVRGMGLEPYYLYRQKNMAGNFENVGYALPGKECLYNVLIMEEKQTIMACGAGTTTKVVFPGEDRHEREENVKDVNQYIERIDEMTQRKQKLLDKLAAFTYDNT